MAVNGRRKSLYHGMGLLEILEIERKRSGQKDPMVIISAKGCSFFHLSYTKIFEEVKRREIPVEDVNYLLVGG